MPEAAKIIEQKKEFTYEDYLEFDDDVRVELIDGKVWDMSPAPTTVHQEILINLSGLIVDKLNKKGCKIYPAPTDVKLSARDVVQPDLLVVCRREIITERCIEGAPDLVVEILSPATELKDRNVKFKLYQKHGVREYWLISPAGYVDVYYLDNGQYNFHGNFGVNDVLTSVLFADLQIEVKNIFRGINNVAGAS